MVDFITKIKKVALSVISLSLLTAMSCGIIDTEQVTDIIEKQQEVERIRAERIDPLLDQIGLIDEETIDVSELMNRIKGEKMAERTWKKANKVQKKTIINNVMSGNVDGSVWGQILIADPKYRKEVNNLNRELIQDALKFADELKLQDE